MNWEKDSARTFTSNILILTDVLPRLTKSGINTLETYFTEICLLDVDVSSITIRIYTHQAFTHYLVIIIPIVKTATADVMPENCQQPTVNEKQLYFF